jgi:hypothetical protein
MVSSRSDDARVEHNFVLVKAPLLLVNAFFVGFLPIRAENGSGSCFRGFQGWPKRNPAPAESGGVS